MHVYMYSYACVCIIRTRALPPTHSCEHKSIPRCLIIPVDRWFVDRASQISWLLSEKKLFFIPDYSELINLVIWHVRSLLTRLTYVFNDSESWENFSRFSLLRDFINNNIAWRRGKPRKAERMKKIKICRGILKIVYHSTQDLYAEKCNNLMY